MLSYLMIHTTIVACTSPLGLSGCLIPPKREHRLKVMSLGSGHHPKVLFPMHFVIILILYKDESRSLLPISDSDPLPRLLLTYGKDDNQLFSMTLGPELLREWLMPVGTLTPRDYRFCTVGRGQPFITTNARADT